MKAEIITGTTSFTTDRGDGRLDLGSGAVKAAQEEVAAA